MVVLANTLIDSGLAGINARSMPIFPEHADIGRTGKTDN